MTTTAIIMANTETIIRIYDARYGVMVLGAALALFATLNLTSTMTSVERSNASIDSLFETALNIPHNNKMELFQKLRDDQAANLARMPSYLMAGAIFSILRYVTTGDPKAAFAALYMSDFVSPYERPELPERAVMWYRFRNVENAEQKAYQGDIVAESLSDGPRCNLGRC